MWKSIPCSEFWGISILAWLESSRGMWQTVSDVSFSNPDLTSRQCDLTRFPIFGILRWILSWFRDVGKRGGWKELDMDQLARTATPRASESWQRVVSFYGTIGSYALQRAVPSPIARPETLIHGQEGRVNTGWPPPHFVQKVSIPSYPEIYSYIPSYHLRNLRPKASTFVQYM